MKNPRKNNENSFKFRVYKKLRKNRVKMGSGALQGSILKSFGERLGAVWGLLGAFLAFLGHSGALL